MAASSGLDELPHELFDHIRSHLHSIDLFWQFSSSSNVMFQIVVACFRIRVGQPHVPTFLIFLIIPSHFLLTVTIVSNL